MRKRRLRFDFVDGLCQDILKRSGTDIIFIRPFGAKLARVYSTPDHPKREELAQVLSTICTRYHKGVWYFRIPDDATRCEIGGILSEMGFEDNTSFIEPDESILN